MKKQLVTGIIVSVMAISLVPGTAFAHVVVTPSTAGIGDYVTFSVSVPNEKQLAVTNLKLEIPVGVKSVTPTSKDGWTITAIKNSDEVNEIVWSHGEIPAGQRQDFSFSAQTPAKAGDLDWKAYQTYADGTVVHWDQAPSSSDGADSSAGPYSVTKVTNDITDATSTAAQPSNTLAVVLSSVAVILSVGSILIRRRR